METGTLYFYLLSSLHISLAPISQRSKLAQAQSVSTKCVKIRNVKSHYSYLPPSHPKFSSPKLLFKSLALWLSEFLQLHNKDNYVYVVIVFVAHDILNVLFCLFVISLVGRNTQGTQTCILYPSTRTVVALRYASTFLKPSEISRELFHVVWVLHLEWMNRCRDILDCIVLSFSPSP